MTDKTQDFSSSEIDRIAAEFLAEQVPATRRIYGAAWQKFRTFHPVGAPCHNRAREFVTHLRGSRGLPHPRFGDRMASGTINTYIAGLSSLFDRIFGLGLIAANPWKHPEIRKIRKKLKGPRKRPTPPITAEKVREMLRCPPTNTPEGLRDRAILAVMFGAGFRRGEVVGFAREDLHIDGRSAMLTARETKSGEERSVTLPPWAAKTLLQYLQMRGPMRPTDPLFSRDDGKPLTDGQIYWMFVNTGRACGIKTSPHAARAAVVTKMLAAGEQYDAIMEVTGHESVDQIEIYNKRRVLGGKQATQRLRW